MFCCIKKANYLIINKSYFFLYCFVFCIAVFYIFVIIIYLFMKLFIVNKEEFDKEFPASQKEIHRKAFNYLMQSIGCVDTIPNVIKIDAEFRTVVFELVNSKNDVYFYSFKI